MSEGHRPHTGLSSGHFGTCRGEQQHHLLAGPALGKGLCLVSHSVSICGHHSLQLCSCSLIVGFLAQASSSPTGTQLPNGTEVVTVVPATGAPHGYRVACSSCGAGPSYLLGGSPMLGFLWAMMGWPLPAPSLTRSYCAAPLSLCTQEVSVLLSALPHSEISGHWYLSWIPRKFLPATCWTGGWTGRCLQVQQWLLQKRPFGSGTQEGLQAGLHGYEWV